MACMDYMETNVRFHKMLLNLITHHIVKSNYDHQSYYINE